MKPMKASLMRQGRRRKRRAPGGFSLLEVLTANVIFFITLSGVLTSLNTIRAQSSQQRHMTVALQVGEYVLEDLLLRYSSSPDLASGTEHRRHFDAAGREIAANGHFVAKWTTTPSEIIRGIREIHLRVEWKLDGQTRAVSFRTLRP